MKQFNLKIRLAFRKIRESQFFLIVLGFISLLWFLLRVIPKPSRAAYPCQRAAFPIASAFVLWIAGTLFSKSIFSKARLAFAQGNHAKALIFSASAFVVFMVTIFGFQIKDSAFSAINFHRISEEGKLLYAMNLADGTQSIIDAEATVAIVRSEKSQASDISFEDIDVMIRKAVAMAGGFDTLIHEGDRVVIKPNVIAARAQNTSYSNAFPMEANGIATDYRIIQVVVNMVREKNKTGKIVMIEGSGYGLTRKNINAIGYDKITGLDSIICLDENIVKWYDSNSKTLTKVSLPKGKNLYSASNVYFLNKVYADANVLISLPCLKSHFLTGITGGIKNVGIGATPVEMYGNGLSSPEDDRPGRWNRINHGDFSTQTVSLDKWIHDFYLCKPVSYVIMDGLQGADYGPYPGSNTYHSLKDVQKNLRVILAGKDPLAVDATEALIAGFDPYLIGHLVYLGKDSIGCVNPARIKIKGTQVHEIKTNFREDNPGKKCKSTDFTAPEVSLSKLELKNGVLEIGLNSSDEITKVEVVYNDTILGPIVVKNFDVIQYPTGLSNLNIGKVSILVYDKFLNCTKLSASSTGIRKLEIGGNLKIYPNPAKSFLKVENPFPENSEAQYSIFNSSGQKIREGQFISEINVGQLNAGLYFLKVTQGKNFYQQAFLKD
jgi:uncharacterized protein (DUF362 family)